MKCLECLRVTALALGLCVFAQAAAFKPFAEDYYERLGVDETVDPESLHDRLREALAWVKANQKTVGENQIAERRLLQAWETLTSEERKAIYDERRVRESEVESAVWSDTSWLGEQPEYSPGYANIPLEKLSEITPTNASQFEALVLSGQDDKRAKSLAAHAYEHIAEYSRMDRTKMGTERVARLLKKYGYFKQEPTLGAKLLSPFVDRPTQFITYMDEELIGPNQFGRGFDLSLFLSTEPSTDAVMAVVARLKSRASRASKDYVDPDWKVRLAHTDFRLRYYVLTTKLNKSANEYLRIIRATGYFQADPETYPMLRLAIQGFFDAEPGEQDRLGLYVAVNRLLHDEDCVFDTSEKEVLYELLLENAQTFKEYQSVRVPVKQVRSDTFSFFMRQFATRHPAWSIVPKFCRSWIASLW